MSDDTTYTLHAPESMDHLTGPAGWPAPRPIPVSVLEATANQMKLTRPDIEIEAVSTFEGDGNTHVAGEFYDSLTASSPVYPNHTVTVTESTHLSFKNHQSQQKLQPKGHEIRVETLNELTGEHTTPYCTFRWAEHREATLQDAQEQIRTLPQRSNPAIVENASGPEIYRQQLRDVAQRLNNNAGPELS